MSLSAVDERALLLPLLDGAAETPPWRSFLRLLAQRTGARHAMLLVRPIGPSFLRPTLRTEARPGLPADEIPPIGVLERNLFQDLGALRLFRVYALAELMTHDGGARATSSGQAGVPLNLADARIVRFASGAPCDGWLIVTDDRTSFGAADSALLSGLAPFIAHAMRQWAETLAREMRLLAAETLLDRTGLCWMLSDSAGIGLAGRLPSPRDGARALVRKVVPAPANASAWVETTLWRLPPAPRDDEAIALLRAEFGLSARESALAWAIASGEPLAEAGTRLGLTRETARNYSKRIYAKTGTRSQADLSRLCHHSLAGLI